MSQHPDRSAPEAARAVGRRAALRVGFAIAAGVALAGCASTPGGAPGSVERYPPIVFMPGNFDSASIWMTTLWRFESNGWPRDRLYAVDPPDPVARDDDERPQPARSGTEDQRRVLAEAVDRALKDSGASKVVLVGNSRGGYAIRSYVREGGAARVAAVVLGGVANHGVFVSDKWMRTSEFNGAGPFLTALNARRPDGSEIDAGPRWLTLRSDNNDKYAQPTGEWIGQPGVPTGVSYDGPALAGADNRVLPGLDHREVSFHPRAFVETWQFLTGAVPLRLAVQREDAPVLDGRITGLAGPLPTNLPLAGARLQIYEVSPQTGERLGAARHARTVGEDGRWGPFTARPDAHYEFVISADGYATAHVYRSPFPRSTSVLHLRAMRLSDAERNAGGALLRMSRPRGYFDPRRDRLALDGRAPAGIPPGVAGVSEARVVLPDATPRPVIAQFNDEHIAMRPWPLSEGHVSIAELTD